MTELQWPSLSRDLAVMLLPDSPFPDIQVILSKYSITDDELRGILMIPRFQVLFKEAIDYFKAQGNRAGAKFRAAILSDSLSEKLYVDAMRGDMKSQEAIKLLELLLKTSGSLEKDGTQVATQVNVGVNLPLPYGLKNPKLKHMIGK